MGCLVGLGKDGGAGLGKYLPLGHVGRFFGDVDVADASEGRRQIGSSRLDVADGLLEPVDARTELFPLGVEGLHGAVQGTDGGEGGSGRGANAENAEATRGQRFGGEVHVNLLVGAGKDADLEIGRSTTAEQRYTVELRDSSDAVNFGGDGGELRFQVDSVVGNEGAVR